MAGLVEAAQQTEAGEGGVVEEPGQEQLGLLGHEAHHQQERAHQAEQADHQEAAQADHAQLARVGGEEEGEDSGNTEEDVDHHHQHHRHVDEGGESEAFPLFDGEHVVRCEV